MKSQPMEHLVLVINIVVLQSTAQKYAYKCSFISS